MSQAVCKSRSCGKLGSFWVALANARYTRYRCWILDFDNCLDPPSKEFVAHHHNDSFLLYMVSSSTSVASWTMTGTFPEKLLLLREQCTNRTFLSSRGQCIMHRKQCHVIPNLMEPCRHHVAQEALHSRATDNTVITQVSISLMTSFFQPKFAIRT